MRDRALAAVLAAAASAGLEVVPDDVVVLRERANLVVHLVPHAVVARTPLWTSVVRPDPWARLSLEVGLSRWAASRGGAVVEPVALAGPHGSAAQPVTLWPLVTGSATSGPGLGQELASLHAALAGYPGPVPGPAEIPGYAARAARVAADAGVLGPGEASSLLAGLDDALRRLEELADRVVPLHGDAHPGNVVVVDGRVTWWDLEDSWRGPVEWDVAVLAGALGPDGPAAVEAYRTASGADLDDRLLAVCGDLRRLQGVAWGALVRTLTD